MATKKETIIELLEEYPDWSQAKIAAEVGATQQYVSQIKNNYGTTAEIGRPNEVTEIADNLAENGYEVVDRYGTIAEPENDNKMTDENAETETETVEPSSWVCDNCGNPDWYDAKDYLVAYSDRINEGQQTLLANSEKVCSGCGKVH